MHLVDYKVRVINARAGTAARVRVVIESKDDDAVWGTVGVSENVIEASWLALVDAFEHKLSKDRRAAAAARQPAAGRDHGVRGDRHGPADRLSRWPASSADEFCRYFRHLAVAGRAGRPLASPRNSSGSSRSRSATASATWSST